MAGGRDRALADVVLGVLDQPEQAVRPRAAGGAVRGLDARKRLDEREGESEGEVRVRVR